MIYVFVRDTETFAKDIVGKTTSRGEKDDKVIIKKGEIDELDEFCKRTGASAWEFNCHKFDGVKDFFIARDDDTIQCITWIYRKADSNRFLVLGKKDALLQFGMTLPEFRGRGLYSATLLAAAKYLGEQGYRRVFGLVECSNQVSIKGFEKAHYVKVAEICLRKVFGIQVSRKLDVSKMD
jgi:RimJ/RimL family protein N-acetyltransferase